MSRHAPLILLLSSALLIPAAVSEPLPSQDRLDQLEAQLTRQGEQLAKAEAELAELRLQTQTVSRACASLSKALNSARSNGFEWAGANPQARTDLLDGLLSFSKTVGDVTRPEKNEEDDPDTTSDR